MHLFKINAEDQLKIYSSVFDCAEMELQQVYFRYTLNILYLKTDIYRDHTTLTNGDIKTLRLNINKYALCSKEMLQIKLNHNIYISNSQAYVSKYVNGFVLHL